MPDLEPFQLIENTPGTYGLLLSEFEPATEVFEEAGVDGGGYAWAAVARHVVENELPELDEQIDIDPESSMFYASAEDRGALTTLGVRLAQLFRDKRRLANVIDVIGPRGFEG